MTGVDNSTAPIVVSPIIAGPKQRDEVGAEDGASVEDSEDGINDGVEGLPVGYFDVGRVDGVTDGVMCGEREGTQVDTRYVTQFSSDTAVPRAYCSTHIDRGLFTRRDMQSE